MKHKLISVALITILLCMVLGNSIGCTSITNYTLTMSSTAGGSVTPAVGAHTYAATTVVNLTATPNSGYRFVNWTATAGAFGSATAASTTFTMPAQDVTVTAHFALGTLIDNVPDTSQPPTNTLQVPNITNYCAPMAMVNILGYWDVVMGHSNAQNLTAFQQPPNLKTVAEYLGWFMDTNNQGRSTRTNAGQLGTLDVDIGPGTVEFVRWDANNQFLLPPPPPPPLPAGKLGYVWTVTTNCTADYGLSLAFYKTEINAGRPLVVSFTYWNPVSVGINVTDPETGEVIDVFAWGVNPGSSHDPNPEEYWSGDVGHAVTGVGYILNWDPDGSGPLGPANYVIVHDNWATTPKNIAIPWANWKCLFAVNP
ncbi:MAG: hypothetical protein MUO99_07420 [Dehalococcoidales bacterium]|nr:hypothetical protein [Dehalococcoidales bacterium]